MNDRPTYPVKNEFPQLNLDKKRGLLGIVRKWWWLIALGAVVLGALVFFAYNYFDTRSKLVNIKDTEVQNLVSEINKYLELPNETPTMATISEASKLKDQVFFKNAQNGDKVLIYSQAGRALLYRPSTHKVIEYSRVNLNTNDPQKKP